MVAQCRAKKRFSKRTSIFSSPSPCGPSTAGRMSEHYRQSKAVEGSKIGYTQSMQERDQCGRYLYRSCRNVPAFEWNKIVEIEEQPALFDHLRKKGWHEMRKGVAMKGVINVTSCRIVLHYPIIMQLSLLRLFSFIKF